MADKTSSHDRKEHRISVKSGSDEIEGLEMESLISDQIQLVPLGHLNKMLDTNISASEPRRSEGLTSERAMEKLNEHGPNELTPPPEKSGLIKFLVHDLGHPLMLLLIVAGILSFIAWGLDTTVMVNLYCAIVLFVAVLVSSIFSYIQEGRASNAMKAFKKMLPRYANVIRDGKLQKISGREVVVGDVIRVASGDQVPADARLIYTNECKVELSSLTGESVPVTCTLTTDAKRVEESHNLIFNTSKVVEGEAIGVVYATGDQTLIGKIAHLASDTTNVLTPIQKETQLFVRNLSLFAAGLGIVFFVIGMAQEHPFISTFINSFILVLVAVCPQGLPLTVVSCLALTARRLAEKHVFVKELRSVETLGSTTVIASDKTGTLTQNRMVLSRIWMGGISFSEASLRDVASTGTLRKQSSVSRKAKLMNDIAMLELIAGVCNRSRYEDEKILTAGEASELEVRETLLHLDPSLTLRRAQALHPVYLASLEMKSSVQSYMKAKYQRTSSMSQLHKTAGEVDEKRRIIGEPTEVALFQFVERRTNIELLRYHWNIVFEQPFNSRNKYAITIVRPNHVEGVQDNQRKLLIKGAPEVVVGKCTNFSRSGEVLPIDADFKTELNEACELFANAGERVLGFGYLDLDISTFGPEFDSQYSLEPVNFPTEGFTFLGLVSLIDPPKATVPDAVAACRGAGVKVFMVTGDHPLTAAAIAKQVGILTLPTREDLAKTRECELAEVQDEDVKAIVLHGEQIRGYTDDDWKKVLRADEIVFARTTPAQKLEIVSQLQKNDHIVAVTGDGVNDAPALKKGDIGIAMGISGSDCSRDAADVILMNDDFSSIVEGIKLGRTIFDNLRKTIAYTLVHLVPETLPTLLNLAFGFPLAMPALFILIIDLGTELAPAVAIAYEPPEANVMLHPPRNSKTDRLVNWEVVRYVFLQGGFIITCMCFLNFSLCLHILGFDTNKLFFTANDYWADGANPLFGHDDTYQLDALAKACTAYWLMLTGSQVFHIFMCRTREVSIFKHGWTTNITLIYGVGIEICLIILSIYAPSSNTIFGTSPFPAQLWAVVLLSWFIFFVLHEGSKWLKTNYPGARFHHYLIF